MERDNFEVAYSKLNPAQKEAVDTIEGPVMIIAGPGTGKTQILTMRIANICRKTDTDPSNILALTFAEASATSMRRRLVELMGSDAYLVTISTFHGFCNDMIRMFPEEFQRLIGREAIDETIRLKIFSGIIDALPLEKLKPFGDNYYYLYSIIESISTLKREGISVNEFLEVVEEKEREFNSIDDLFYESGAHKGKMRGVYQDKQKEIQKQKELVVIYEAYEKALEDHKFYDYDDMISEVYRALLNNENLLLLAQEKYHYILVDEHQDTNRSQNKIVELLASFHDNPNIFVVGDEKQAIFRFQGASLENFLYFKEIYKEVKVIVLEENYRSTQTILDAAHSIIAGKKILKAMGNNPESKINVSLFSSDYAEDRFVSLDIKEKINSGVKPDQIAVLYRHNKDALDISERLEKEGVPFVIDPSGSILQDPVIKKIMLVLEAIDSFGDQGFLMKVMHLDFFNIDQVDLLKIISYCDQNKISIFEVLDRRDVLESLELKKIDAVFNFFSLMKEWALLKHNNSLPRLFEDVSRKGGVIAKLITSNESIDGLEKLNGLFKELKTFISKNKNATLRNFLDHLKLMDENDIALPKLSVSPTTGKVRLMTAHRSKGLEFDYVYIIKAIDSKWGGKERKKKIPLPSKIFSISGKDLEVEDDNDERRLFYVALTRAKKEIQITYSNINASNKENLPTQFLSEIRSDVINYLDRSASLSLSKEDLALDYKDKAISVLKFDNPEMIKEIVMRKGISPTDVNNYLNCPWRYFYNSLFKIPQAMNKYNMFGSAVHSTLEDYFHILKEDGERGEDFVMMRFQFHLSKHPLTELEFKTLLAMGKKSLPGFIQKYAGTWGLNALMEFSVKGVSVSDIPVKGRIDRLEIFGSSGEVRVTDFKTGKPKTRGQIEGVTKDSNGEIKRQIVFYKLLLDKYQGGKYKMQEGIVDFVQPDEKGKYHREVFAPDENDVMKLEDEIRFVFNDIINLNFWNKRCDDNDCEYCALRALYDK